MTTTTTTTGQSRVMVMIEDRETMMTQDAQRKQAWGSRVRLMLGILLALTLLPAARAETITIGQGSGIVWEGLPFNETTNNPYPGAATLTLTAGNPVLSAGDTWLSLEQPCMRVDRMVNMSGFDVFPVAQGLGIIPRIRASITYKIFGGLTETTTGTIGLPSTRGGRTSGPEVIAPFYSAKQGTNVTWCLPPTLSQTDILQYFATNTFNANYVGNWVLVADGTQVGSTTFTLPRMTFGTSMGGSFFPRVFYSTNSVSIRVSTLQCTVATTTAINFGSVERNTTAGSELASQTYPLTVSCSQDTDRINANVNVQFRPLSGLYNGNVRQLALTQGGGYITGEINNGVTGSGACNLNTGIPFDITQLKVGAIASTETSKTFNNQVTWRLCSGGVSLPTGPVTASADMLVTFN